MKFFVVTLSMLFAFNSQAVELGQGKVESMTAAAINSPALSSVLEANSHLSKFNGVNVSPVRLNSEGVRSVDVHVNYVVDSNPCVISIEVTWENTSTTGTPNFAPVVKGMSGSSVSCKLSN